MILRFRPRFTGLKWRKTQGKGARGDTGAGGAGACAALRGFAALAHDAAALTLGAAAPDAFALASSKRELETCLADRADVANCLGWTRFFVRYRKEEIGINASTCSSVPPCGVHRALSHPKGYLRGF